MFIDVPTKSYIALIELAMENGHRTALQQKWLVDECERLDNVFVNWSQRARDTWTSKPCEACGRAIGIVAGCLCPRCERHEAEHRAAAGASLSSVWGPE
jgi:hypothetical protein